ncbi:hypothetical protein Tco_1491212 [Tanacetum coccineum]
MPRTSRTHDGEDGSSRSKCPRQHETVEEVFLPQVHHEFLLWEGCTRDTKSRYNTRLAQLLPRHIYSPCIVNWDVLNQMGCDGEIDEMLRIRVREAASEEEFDKVCADDELQTKKIIKFRLGGRAHSLPLLQENAKYFALSEYAKVGGALTLYDVEDKNAATAEMEYVSISLKGNPCEI